MFYTFGSKHSSFLRQWFGLGTIGAGMLGMSVTFILMQEIWQAMTWLRQVCLLRFSIKFIIQQDLIVDMLPRSIQFVCVARRLSQMPAQTLAFPCRHGLWALYCQGSQYLGAMLCTYG